jgi:hypothetical protein
MSIRVKMALINVLLYLIMASPALAVVVVKRLTI